MDSREFVSYKKLHDSRISIIGQMSDVGGR